MKKLNISFAVFLLLIAAGYFWNLKSKPGNEPASLRTEAEQHAQTAAPAPASNPREQMFAAYRLQPDRRCLCAVAEINHLLAAADSGDAEAVFQNGRWHIRLKDTEIGELPEFPDFPDLLALLTKYASGLKPAKVLHLHAGGSARPQIENALSELSAVKAAAIANQLWQRERHDYELLHGGLKAATLLAFLDMDQTGTSDIVATRALALLAATQAATGQSFPREECLLAEGMGYFSHAKQLAMKLPQTDALRWYLQGDDLDLKTHTQDADCALDASYFRARQLADRYDTFGWLELTGRRFTNADINLPTLQTGLAIDSFEFVKQLTAQLMRQAAIESAPFIVMEDTNYSRPKGLLPMAEFGLAHIEVQTPGPFLDRALLQAYYRGCIYSSFQLLGLHCLDKLSSIDAAKDFDKLLGPVSETGGPANQFKNWYVHLVEAKEGHANVGDLRQDLVGLNAFGLNLRSRTLEELESLLPFGDNTMLDIGRDYAARLDTRSSHRLDMAQMARRNLYAPGLYEELMRNTVPLLGWHYAVTQAYFANLQGDRKRLEELLATPELTPYQKAVVIGYLKNQNGVTTNEVRRLYEQLIAANPDVWDVASEYVDFLEELKDYPTARHCIQNWLDRKVKDASVFDEIYARTRMAKLLEREGRYAEGLAVVDPAAKSYQSGAMECKALLLGRFGCDTDALTLAQKIYERYPDRFHSVATLVELHWRSHHYAEAAACLARHPYPIQMADWRWTLGPIFIDCFSGNDTEALKAADALVQDGLGTPDKMGQLAFYAGQHDCAALALEMLARIHADGFEQLQVAVWSYGYLKSLKGETFALEWMRQQVPENLRSPLSMFAHENDAPELLWEVAPTQLTGNDADYFWLMRAAANLKPGMNTAPRVKALKEYYSKPPASYYDEAGRYLLGLANENELLAAAISPKQKCELYYFIGYKAQCENRISDAAEWYWLSYASLMTDNGEAHWSLTQLYSWSNASKCLSRLQTITHSQPPEQNRIAWRN